MGNTVIVTGKTPFEAAQKKEALQFLNDNGSAEDLLKLKKLAGNPAMKAMLKGVKL